MWSVSTDPGPPVFLARSLLSHQRSPEAPRSSKREVTAGAVSASSTAVGASTSHSAGSRASGPLTSARTCPHLHLPTLAHTCPHPLTPTHTHTCPHLHLLTPAHTSTRPHPPIPTHTCPHLLTPAHTHPHLPTPAHTHTHPHLLTLVHTSTCPRLPTPAHTRSQSPTPTPAHTRPHLPTPTHIHSYPHLPTPPPAHTRLHLPTPTHTCPHPHPLTPAHTHSHPLIPTPAHSSTCQHLLTPAHTHTRPHPLTPAHTHTCTCTQSTDRERLHYTHGHVCSGLWVFVSFLHTSCVGWMPVTVIHHYSRTITKIPEGCLTAPSPVETEDSGRSQELPVRTDAQSATWQPVHTIGSSSGAQSCVRGQHRLHGVRRAPT